MPRGRGSPTPSWRRCSARSSIGSPRCTAGATTRAPAGRRTSRAGTATSTRISGRSSGAQVRGPYLAALLRGGRARVVPRGALGALDAAAAELEAKQGPAPSAWRADATAERIRFTSGVLPDTMRWTNRPTFQQLMSFSITSAALATLDVVRKRYLMAPGPTPVPPEVLAAGAAPIIHHRGPDFRELMLADARATAAGLPHGERRPALHCLGLRARSSRRS